jgi:predicted phosphodiesterase
MVEKRHTVIFLLLGLVAATVIAGCIGDKDIKSSSEKNSSEKSSSEYTIAYISDGRPSKDTAQNTNNLTKDFNQIILQSPTKRVDAVIMLGDMDYINQTSQAYAESTAKNIPVFYVVGNHELDNKVDLPEIRQRFAAYDFNPRHGPAGSSNTTYSFNLGDIHVVVLNEYWDGNNNGVCDWLVPKGGINSDESCFKYDNVSDGGFIPDALFTWLENDLNDNTKNWTIVVGHEPMYPQKRHIGDSLDKNLTNRNRLESILTKNNVAAYVGAHTHFSNVTTINGIFHVDGGVSGVYTSPIGKGDPFASIIYTTVNSSGYFELTHARENPTWTTPKSITLSKSQSKQIG